MTKSELIQKLAEANPHLYQRDIEVIVTAIFDEIAAALARGDRVELRGFGAFSVRHRDARVGRNPRTGNSVEVAEKHVPFFKTGGQLGDRLNHSPRAHPPLAQLRRGRAERSLPAPSSTRRLDPGAHDKR